jgi:Mrp family chromosome partitioning ATPase
MSSRELVKLHHFLVSTMDNDERGIITQFVGPEPDAAVRDVVFDLAYLTAEWLGKRVLFVDGTGIREEASHPDKKGRHRREPSIQTTTESFDGGKNTISRIAGLEMYVMTFPSMRGALEPLPEIRRIPDFLAKLRDNFEMILVAAPPTSDAPMATLLSRFVDGNVLVLQAGHTRLPVAAELRDSLRTAGGPVVGAVLTHCRSFVPRFLRRWF